MHSRKINHFLKSVYFIKRILITQTKLIKINTNDKNFQIFIADFGNAGHGTNHVLYLQ